MEKAIFLDRDGVINEAIVKDGRPYPPKDISELILITGIKKLLYELKQKKYLIIVITNQPDVARKKTLKKDVEEINNYLLSNLPIDEIITCYHDNNDGCNCRKPLPGSILEAAKKYKINLNKSFMIGDRWRDIMAGRNANCKTIFIDYKYDEEVLAEPDYTINSIIEILEVIN